MTHLRIEQNNGVIEEVSSSVITKLYEIAHAGLDVSSNLLGRLHTPISYRHEILYLTSTYPNLYISADNYAIPFEDPNMVTYLNSIGVGNNGAITEALAAAATVVANSANTQVTRFNELRYFTNITSSRGGWTGGSSGYTRFYLWTALEEVDISNFTSLGDVQGSAWEDTFVNCTALKTVTASDKLTRIGHNAFFGCTNLEHIIGLSGTIQISSNAFCNCGKLTDSDIQNATFLFAIEGGNTLRGQSAFEGTRFTEVNTSLNNTELPSKCFYNNTALLSVNGLDNIVIVGGECFRNCSSLLSLAFGGNVTTLYNRAFDSCSSLTTVTGLSNVTTIQDNVFYGCTNLTSVDIDFSKLNNNAISAISLFKNCAALQQVDLSTIVTLGTETFCGCTQLRSIGSLNNVLSIGSSTFKNCSNVQEFINLSIPNLVTMNDGDASFQNCTQILHVLDLGRITTLGNVWSGTFQGCTNLLDVTIPSTVTTIKVMGIASKIGCPNIRWVKILSTQVPLYDDTTGHGYHGNRYGFGEDYLGNGTYSGLTYPIYVLDNLYLSYLAADDWSHISSRLRPMSLFATDFPNG